MIQHMNSQMFELTNFELVAHYFANIKDALNVNVLKNNPKVCETYRGLSTKWMDKTTCIRICQDYKGGYWAEEFGGEGKVENLKI